MTPYEKRIKEIKAFKNMLESRLCFAFDRLDDGNDEPMDTLHANDFTLSFMGKHCKLYFGACEYQAVIDMLTTILEDMQS